MITPGQMARTTTDHVLRLMTPRVADAPGSSLCYAVNVRENRARR
jgi:hypothetical protein